MVPVFSGPASFLWKGDSSALPGLRNDRDNTNHRVLEVVDHNYCFVVTYTREDLKDELIKEAEKVSVEEVCMMSFIPFEWNPALIKLLDDRFEDREKATEPPPHIDALAALTFVPLSEAHLRTKSSFERTATE